MLAPSMMIVAGVVVLLALVAILTTVVRVGKRTSP